MLLRISNIIARCSFLMGMSSPHVSSSYIARSLFCGFLACHQGVSVGDRPGGSFDMKSALLPRFGQVLLASFRRKYLFRAICHLAYIINNHPTVFGPARSRYPILLFPSPTENFLLLSISLTLLDPRRISLFQISSCIAVSTSAVYCFFDFLCVLLFRL